MRSLFHAALLMVLFLAATSRGAEDRYDLLGKVLKPFVGLFARDGAGGLRALRLTVSIEQMTGLPAELVGARSEIAIESPDKLRLHGPILGETFTLVRDRELLWIHPAAQARALLEGTAEAGLPAAEKKFQLSEFRLPIPEKQLVFLPVLFAVNDVGREFFGGRECRVLDVRLMPELGRALEVQGWVARLWVNPDATPARLTLARKGWNVVLRFEQVAFSESLPASTWKPSTEESADYLELRPKDYGRFLRAITGGEEAKKKSGR